MSRELVIYFLIQLLLVAGASALSLQEQRVWLVVNLLLLVVSAACSLGFFSRHTTFLSGLSGKIKGHFKH